MTSWNLNPYDMKLHVHESVWYSPVCTLGLFLSGAAWTHPQSGRGWVVGSTKEFLSRTHAYRTELTFCGYRLVSAFHAIRMCGVIIRICTLIGWQPVPWLSMVQPSRVHCWGCEMVAAVNTPPAVKCVPFHVMDHDMSLAVE